MRQDSGLNPDESSLTSRREMIKWAVSGAAVGFGGIALGSANTGDLHIERAELRLRQWDADGFRVGMASDLHTNSWLEVERARRAIQMLVEEKPDLIVLPGDFVNYGDPQSLRWIVESLEPLHEAKCPVLATLGNHDYSGKNVAGVIDALGQTAAKLLVNQSFELDGISIFGFDDAISADHDPVPIIRGNWSRSLLTLLHEPDLADAMPPGISLQLSGHSHGGQICLPGGIPMHMPIGAEKYNIGFYPNLPTPVYVSKGVGTVGPRLRLFCPPEINILTLRSA